MTCHEYQVILRTLRHLTPRDILGGNHPPPSTPPGSVWTPARLHRQHCLGQDHDQRVRWRTATGQVLLRLPGHPLHSVKNVILLTLVSRCVKDSPLQSVGQQKTKLIWIGIKLNKLLSFLVLSQRTILLNWPNSPWRCLLLCGRLSAKTTKTGRLILVWFQDWKTFKWSLGVRASVSCSAETLWN